MAVSPTFAATLRSAADALAAAGVESARLDAEVLLAAAAGTDRTRLVIDAQRPVPTAVLDRFATWLRRRVEREPLQYIVGTREFWSLDFIVTPDVLIPRPETEVLVEQVAARLRSRDGAVRICDVGTGSGCIAVALARELPAAEVWALDASTAALAVAARNCQRHGVAERVRLVASDLLAAVADQSFDCIVANLPYAAGDALDGLQPELAWEPRGALDGGRRGLEPIARLIEQAPACLVRGGVLALEIGYDQAEEVCRSFGGPGWGAPAVRNDLQGWARVVIAARAG